jgi:hypothetical protein
MFEMKRCGVFVDEEDALSGLATKVRCREDLSLGQTGQEPVGEARVLYADTFNRECTKPH